MILEKGELGILNSVWKIEDDIISILKVVLGLNIVLCIDVLYHTSRRLVTAMTFVPFFTYFHMPVFIILMCKCHFTVWTFMMVERSFTTIVDVPFQITFG